LGVQKYSPLHVAFGRAIRALREEREISQEDMAIMAGMDRSYVGGIERGERNPSLKNVLALTDALGVSTVDLFDRFEQLRTA
jgi:transcriptional regulator with XRE-family HTH domain